MVYITSAHASLANLRHRGMQRTVNRLQEFINILTQTLVTSIGGDAFPSLDQLIRAKDWQELQDDVLMDLIGNRDSETMKTAERAR